MTFLIAYVIALLLIRFLEPHFLFFPNYPDRLGGDWNPRALQRQEVWFNASDGTKLYGWWIPADNAKFTFLAFHGNAGNIADRTYLYEFLRGTPANVLRWSIGAMDAVMENSPKRVSIKTRKQP